MFVPKLFWGFPMSVNILTDSRLKNVTQNHPPKKKIQEQGQKKKATTTTMMMIRISIWMLLSTSYWGGLQHLHGFPIDSPILRSNPAICTSIKNNNNNNKKHLHHHDQITPFDFSSIHSCYHDDISSSLMIYSSLTSSSSSSLIADSTTADATISTGVKTAGTIHWDDPFEAVVGGITLLYLAFSIWAGLKYFFKDGWRPKL